MSVKIVNPNLLVLAITEGLQLGLGAMEIVRNLCAEHGGSALPDLATFDARTDELAARPDLAGRG